MTMSGSMDNKEDYFAFVDAICAICDNGGDLICCEGKCLRSFHATVEAGSDSACSSLHMSEKLVQEVNFICDNCQYSQHQCFICGKLGSSDKSTGVAEVFQCGEKTCGYFYHSSCVTNSLRFKYEDESKDEETEIASGKPFICPLHFCYACKEKEERHKTEFLMQFAVCRRCPMAYHRKCLPGEIAFEADDDAGIITRAWEELIPNKIMIYCMEHLIDEELETPIRNHIKFPRTHLKKMKEVKEQVLESVGEVKTIHSKGHRHPLKVLEKRKASKSCSEKLSEAGQLDKSSVRCPRSSGLYYLQEPKLSPASKASIQLHKSSSVSYRNISGSYLFRDRKSVTKYMMCSLVQGFKRKASTLDDDSSYKKNMSMDSCSSKKRMTTKSRELVGSKDSLASKPEIPKASGLETMDSSSSKKRMTTKSRELVGSKESLASKPEIPKASGLETMDSSSSKKRMTTKSRELVGTKDSLASKSEIPKASGLETPIVNVKAIAINKKAYVVSKLEDSKEVAAEEEREKCSSGSDENHSNVKVDSETSSGMHKSTSCSKSMFISFDFASGPYFPPTENNSIGWLTE